ncbi:MAG: DUF2156 domain-containing protein [Desulfobacter sp.]|nr:MAG: DUF2156 domain-containing protein [Desulfobacter sp.]
MPCCTMAFDEKSPVHVSGFTKFTMDTAPMVKGFLNRYPSLSCEYNFVTLFCWAKAYQYSWFTYKGRFFIFDGVDNLIFMPLGPAIAPEDLKQISAHFAGIGLGPDICLATKAYLDAYPQIKHFYTISQDRDAAEYLYLAQSLAELKGSKLHKKRNLISQFKRRFPDFTLGALTADNIFDVKAFAKDLLHTLDPFPRALADEFSAMETAFDHWSFLGLEGLVLAVEGKIAAFSVFSPLNKDTYNIHFEKSNMAFKGAAQVINQETARLLAEKTKYINREQDLGIPGLRQAKLSYAPCTLLTPYILRFKKD